LPFQDQVRGDDPFYEMVREFTAFKRKYKSTHVSKALKSEYPELAKLAHWINKNRGKLTNLDRGVGKAYGMTKGKLEVLEEVGFERAVSRHGSWDRMFEALREYVKERGHCNVRTKYKKSDDLAKYKKLAHWVRYVGVG
jgi:Helicase associated domain